MRYLVTGLLLVVALNVSVAYASEITVAPDKKWSFLVTPYVWGTGMQGTVGLPPLRPSNVDASFGDIISHVNLGFMGTWEVRKGRFGFVNDISWMRVSGDASVRPSPFTRTLDVTSDTLMSTGFAAYRAIEKERGWLDLLLGVRGWYVSANLDVGPGIFASGRTISGDEGWVDVMGGVRARINLGHSFYATAWTLVGGGSSDSVVDLAGTVGYAFTDSFSATAGYRYTKVDYSKPGFVWNLEYQGPVLGGTFKF